MFDFISCVVLYRFVYQPRLTYLFCVVNYIAKRIRLRAQLNALYSYLPLRT